MLKSLTAKAVCDALLDLFVNVGVPKVIISDQGTNFTSQLTREMLSCLGCCPRFNTPGHPEYVGSRSAAASEAVAQIRTVHGVCIEGGT